MHPIGSLICNKHDKLMVKMTILFLTVWHVKDGVVHHSRQQCLIAKWLGLGVTARVRVRLR